MTDDRRARMEGFVEWCAAHISGDEKGEAQTFLDRLFKTYGHAGAKEAGAVFENRIKRSGRAGTGFADLVWEDTVLIEMKKRGEPLEKHTQQMLSYWVGLAGHRPAYCILCNFDEFRIFDFNKDILKPVDILTLDKLPDRYDVLAFLFPTREEPVFGDDHEAVTREAADHLAAVFRSLVARGTARPQAQRFVLQTLVALFAEDIELLAKNFVLKLLDECDTPAKSYDLLDGLFKAMNTKGGVNGGRYKGVKYFNGGLFADSAAVELNKEEIKHLRKAAEQDWSKVRPEIFGTIFEHSLDAKERHAFGAHFTSQLDILKIVKPTITDPWEELIDRTAKGKQPLANLNRLHQRLQNYRVLDPACGSGNFLYLAYRELKRIEAKLIEAIQDATKEKTPMFGRVTARQFYGLDINPFAVELAKVTLMIARKLAIDELHIEEPALPLDNLDDNFRTIDALITFPEDGSDPVRTEWPKVDVIIGNPPFLGAKRLKPEHGPDYVNAVRRLYPEVPGMADYCVYWIRRSHDHLPVCTPADPVAGRAGLVGTQNIRNNKSREGGLDHVVASGVIVEAVDNQPWSGEAHVHVAIANWVKTIKPESAGEELLVPNKRRLWVKAEPRKEKKSSPSFKTKGKRPVRKEKSFDLTYRDAELINPALSDKTDVTGAFELSCNISPQLVYQGQVPGHEGFVLSPNQAKKLTTINPKNEDVVHPFLIGRDVVTGSGQPTRYVIDFQNISIAAASAYKEPLKIIQTKVLPSRELAATQGIAKDGSARSHHTQFLKYWWRHSYDRPELIGKISCLGRYIVCSGVTKRPIFCFVDSDIRPDHAVFAFVLDDDYSFGIIQAQPHWLWFTVKCSKLAERFRYTPPSVWDTFPWPQSPSNADIGAVAEAGRVIRRIRDEHLPKMTGGLRALYRTLELPGKNPLKDAHAALDDAVMKAYGFSPKKDLLQQLLDLNLEVAAAEAKGDPVTAPGFPPAFAQRGGDPAALITDDCIRPPKL
jgi:SAM-dependent methyltransferase